MPVRISREATKRLGLVSDSYRLAQQILMIEASYTRSNGALADRGLGIRDFV